MVICSDRTKSEELALDLQFFGNPEQIRHFSSWDTLPLESLSPQLDISAQRIRLFSALASGSPSIITTSIDAVLQKLLPRWLIDLLTFKLCIGVAYKREELLQNFESCGFRRVALVEEVGELAVRGNIIDFYPATEDLPVRLEFRDDTLLTLRLFEPSSQRSVKTLEQISVLPVAEKISIPSHPGLRELLPQALARIKAQADKLEVSSREFSRVAGIVESGADYPGAELFQPFILGNMENIFDYLPPHSLIVIDDSMAVESALDAYVESIELRAEKLAHEDCLLPDSQDLYLTSHDFEAQLKKLELLQLDSLELELAEQHSTASTLIRTQSNTELSTRLKTLVGSGNALEPLARYVKVWRAEGYQIAFSAGSKGRAARLQRLLLELDLHIPIMSGTAADWLMLPHRPVIVIIQGLLSAGFQLPDEKLIFISESEIFAERSYRKAPAAATNIKRLLNAIAQLKDGDFVVHNDYGIGIYRGLRHKRVDGALSDLIQIDYADSSLFLPIQHIGKIQKFNAADGKAPSIDKLGSKRWLNTKRRVRESVVTLAGDLVKLYATRSIAKGWRFEPAGAEDERFADGFPFNETPDQLTAIEETLADLARDRPMDRLICGDVGFGKTEVAIRAAFKCIQHARQVVLLAPTTLLVEQHTQNIASRFAGYPVKVAALSRFHPAVKNRETLAQLAAGDIDIVVGTHRLLQRDVQFHDLGLVIIDEEHRFGVKQKERLKQIKKQVDVLTLTATPIPRTMHMALLGIRDISVINTAPTDRRLIRTYVALQDDDLIRDAIMRELQRGGQCFYVNNRIEGIEGVTAHLRELIPEARIEFAHGQMPELKLERIMARFLEGKIDVLVSTTIIESGLDIPNANTIVINRADMFGLAQLYQMRGRVGRSARQAFAYFLVPKSGKLSSDAQKRLKVLQSLDDLGLGFNLAIRDLEIRGAGNLLGREQSGNVLLVGYELYCKILKEAILNLKGEELSLEESIDTEVKVPLDAYIPEFYIPDVSERLILYQRLAGLESYEESRELEEEMIDRFGSPSPEVQNLIEIMRLRSLFKNYGIEKAEFSEMRATLAFSPRAPIDAGKAMELVKSRSDTMRFTRNHTLSVSYDPEMVRTPALLYPMMQELLEKIGR